MTPGMDIYTLRVGKIVIWLIVSLSAWVAAPVHAQADIATPESQATSSNRTVTESQNQNKHKATEAKLRTELKAAEDRYGLTSEQVRKAFYQLSTQLTSVSG